MRAFSAPLTRIAPVCAQGQPHAFVTDWAAIQAGGAAGEAWDALVAFLRLHALLPPKPPLLHNSW